MAREAVWWPEWLCDWWSGCVMAREAGIFWSGRVMYGVAVQMLEWLCDCRNGCVIARVTV